MTLGMNFFVTNLENPEEKRKKFKEELNRCLKCFSRFELYPDFAELIELHRMVMTVFHRKELLEEYFLHNFKIDPEKQLLISEPTIQNHDETERKASEHIKISLELIEWSLECLHKAIHEGVCTYEFVAKKITFKTVGIVPEIQKEGYLFIADERGRVIHIYHFNVFVRSAHTDDPERVLNTEEIDRVDTSLLQPPLESVKAELIQKHPDLPVPATFVATPELDFPYTAATFPVAKREFLKLVAV